MELDYPVGRERERRSEAEERPNEAEERPNEAHRAARGQARAFSSSVCFWFGDFQPRTAIGILLERRK